MVSSFSAVLIITSYIEDWVAEASHLDSARRSVMPALVSVLSMPVTAPFFFILAWHYWGVYGSLHCHSLLDYPHHKNVTAYLSILLRTQCRYVYFFLSAVVFRSEE